MLNKVLPFLAFSILLLVPIGSQNAFAETTMTVNSDKPCYVKLDTVTVSGSVSEVIPNTLVAIRIVSNIGNLVVLEELEVAPDGSYTGVFTAGGPLWSSEGTYIVRAEYKQIIDGFTLANAETTFEFNFNMCPQLVGGTLIPLDTTVLLLASAQSFSWMIPVILSGIGIGLFVVSRKSKNS